MQALLAAVDAKDTYTRAHSIRVARYADAIARRVRLSPGKLRTLQAAALLHDLGKIGVPDRILTKAGPLDEAELDVIERHPQIALDILSPMRFLTNHRPIVLYHHERYDGEGYPGRLSGETIPLESRILTIADAVDTMFSPRPYKGVFSLGEVRGELLAGAGRQFDPHLAHVALDWLEEPNNEAAMRAAVVCRQVRSAGRNGLVARPDRNLQIGLECRDLAEADGAA